MRENCTYGLTRGRAYPARGALLYSTKIDTVAEFLDNVRMRKNRVIESVLYRDALLSQVVATWNRLKTEEQELFNGTCPLNGRSEAGNAGHYARCINKLTLLSSVVSEPQSPGLSARCRFLYTTAP